MIKFLCTVDGPRLHFSVLKQDESQRFKGEFKNDCYKRRMSNGLHIASYILPMIDDDFVFIRGNDRNYDRQLSCICFRSENEALSHRDKVIEALEEWSRLGGFERNPGAARTYGQDKAIFTF